MLPRLLNVIVFVFKYCKRIAVQSCSHILCFQKIPWCESGHIARAASLYILIKCMNDIFFLVHGTNKICKTLPKEHLMCEWFRFVTWLSTAEIGNWSLEQHDTIWHINRQEEHQGPSLCFLWVPIAESAAKLSMPPSSPAGTWILLGFMQEFLGAAVSPVPSGMQEPPSTFTAALQNWDTWDFRSVLVYLIFCVTKWHWNCPDDCWCCSLYFAACAQCSHPALAVLVSWAGMEMLSSSRHVKGWSFGWELRCLVLHGHSPHSGGLLAFSWLLDFDFALGTALVLKCLNLYVSDEPSWWLNAVFQSCVCAAFP